jgi:glutamate synthase domain-containing protein 2
MEHSLANLFSKSRKGGLSQAEVKRKIKEWKRAARIDQKEAARFEYDSIVKKAERIKSHEKRVEFVEGAIDEVRVKSAEEKQRLGKMLRNGDLNDPENAREYLYTLALTVRKLKILLWHERSSTPKLSNHGGPKHLNPGLNAAGDSAGTIEVAAGQSKAKKVLNAKEISSTYGIPLNTLYKMTTEESERNGKVIPYRHIGKKLIFIPAEIEEWLKKR